MLSFSKTMEVQQRSERRRGSLPLKKRRFQPIKQEALNSDFVATISPLPSVLPSTVHLTPNSTALVPLLEHGSPYAAMPYSEDKIAALALVAARCQSMPPTSSNNDESSSSSSSSSLSPTDEMTITTTTASEEETAATSTSRMMTTTTTSSSGGPRQQQPLPGGCHGRSSRHNSYCRRQPCYNGSKYCKLHYRQYVVRAATTATAAAAEQEQDEQVLKSPSAAARGSSKVTMTSSSTSTTPQHHQHQDRRYMGAPGEIRCLATTTRGRACAYISVHGTKYCYLHSDYDTNPPPRRGGCGTPVLSTAKADDHHHGQAATATTTASSTTTTTTTTSARLAEKKGLKRRSRRSPVNGSNSAKIVSPRPASAALSEVSIPSVSSEESSAKERKKTPSRRTSAKLKEKHADSPFPLLSMISTDQWGQKKVRIATGPFEGRSGEVKKWGNGWVSVRIPGVGLHNRRSFELYLHSDEDAQKTTARSSNEQDTNNIDDAKSLFRCVSHDAGSPSPAATVTPRPVKSALTTVTNGPRMPHVMETPKRAPKTVIKSVTPSVLQKPRVEATVPLVDSLLISPAGVVDGACVASSKKFDMLFGTAALERSRRSIHKPTRYEDTEMLEKKRSRDEGDDRPAAEKRPCIEAAK